LLSPLSPPTTLASLDVYCNKSIGKISQDFSGRAIFMAGLCFAFRWKVSYPDGTPAAGAQVSLVDKDGGKKTVVCDANGIFQFAELPPDEAEVQINARGKLSKGQIAGVGFYTDSANHFLNLHLCLL
jgi:hypothetical protein